MVQKLKTKLLTIWLSWKRSAPAGLVAPGDWSRIPATVWHRADMAFIEFLRFATFAAADLLSAMLVRHPGVGVAVKM